MTGESLLTPEVEAAAIALASLPAMGPRRLRDLVFEWDPEEAWSRVRQGRAVPSLGAEGRAEGRRCGWEQGRGASAAELSALWQDASRGINSQAQWEVTRAAGVGVSIIGMPGYPPLLAGDHQAPAVLFHRGNLATLNARRVAIVGTRRCTHYGLDVARELGRDLARAGVAVVSGLALGIDGAAHRGALEADRTGSVVAVVAGGLDIVYPRAHRALWSAVAANGVMLSEAPLGTPPERWRFPVRNRLIAAAAEVVVVVESHDKGGSHYTVVAAEERALTVMAVPGSVRSPASAYTNGLIADGCAPARDATDVLVALGLSTGTSEPATAEPSNASTVTPTKSAGTSEPVTSSTPGAASDAAPPRGLDVSPDGSGSSVQTSAGNAPGRAPLSMLEATVLDALGWEPASLEQVVTRVGLGPLEVGLALAHIERDGWAVSSGGWWRRTRR